MPLHSLIFQPLARFSNRASAAARYLIASPEGKISQWREASSQAVLKSEERALEALTDLIRLGPPPGEAGDRAISETLRMSASKQGRSALLLALIGAGLHRDELDADGLSPLSQAIYWQNLEAVEILAPRSSFATPGERRGDWHPEIARRGPLAMAASELDPECAEICLRWMSPEQREDQVPHALRQLAWAMDLAIFRDQDGLGSTLDSGSRPLSQVPPLERGVRLARALFDSLPPRRMELLPHMAQELRDDGKTPGSIWAALRVAFEARALEIASHSAPDPAADPAPRSRPPRL